MSSESSSMPRKVTHAGGWALTLLGGQGDAQPAECLLEPDKVHRALRGVGGAQEEKIVNVVEDRLDPCTTHNPLHGVR